MEAQQRLLVVTLLIVSFAVIASGMYLLRDVLIPFVLAAFLTYSLFPVMEFLRRNLRLPRAVALVATILLGMMVLFSFGVIIGGAVNEVSANQDAYVKKFEDAADWVASVLPFKGFKSKADVVDKLKDLAPGVLDRVVGATRAVLQDGLLVLVFLVFMLAGKRVRDKKSGGIFFEIESRVKRYLLTLIFISATTGILVGTSLYVLGVPFAWMFGFLAFLLNFIPNVGSIIATLLPVPVALASPELATTAKVLVVVIPGCIQFGIGNLLQPKIMGQSLDLHPVTLLVALTFFAVIWGLVGALLATPITAIIKILLDRFEYTKPLGKVLAGDLDAALASAAPPDPDSVPH